MTSFLTLGILISIVSVSTNPGHTPKRLPITHLVPKFDFARQCKNTTLPLELKELSFHYSGNGRIVSLTARVQVLRRIEKITKTVISFFNCADKSEASCQLFQTWRFHEESCSFLQMKNQFWSPFFGRVEPPLRCPIQPIEYYQKNGTMDAQLLQAFPFPLEKYYWRCRVDAYDPGQFFCAEYGIYFLRTRARA